MNRSLVAIAVVAVIAVGAGAIFLMNRPPQTAQPLPSQGSNPPPEAGTLRGVSLSPLSYTGPEFTAFLVKAKQAGSVLIWSGDWAELSNPKGAPYVVSQLAANNDLKPVVIAQFFTQSTKQLIRPLNDSAKRSYKAGAVDFAKAYRPDYIGFGIEIDALHEASPGDYASFKAFFPEVVAAVKQVSPSTKVFTVFQLERLRGLKGGLFGGVNDTARGDWGLLADFPDADLLAFTTYPCLVYKDPSNIPLNYYTEVAKHTSKPVAFTEAGWFRAGPKGWESSPEEQAQFVVDYIELTSDLRPRLLVWSFLYDQEVGEPFTTMGLMGKDGSPTPGWEAWMKP